MARSLGGNEDLVEAICLAHDWAAPFGHVGEGALNELMKMHGGYNRQRQTYRILTELERRYPEHPGLNLTYEVLEVPSSTTQITTRPRRPTIAPRNGVRWNAN